MAIIKAEEVVKKYGDFSAVNGIDFQIDQGECFGFLGPNGAGKTTTVKMIYCFSPVTAGHLTVLGMDVRRCPREIKRFLGVVPQEDNLDPELTVWQNLMLYAGYFDIVGREACNRTEELLEFTGLSENKSMTAEQLSGGMKRRLTIARALINRPRVLILDEPTTGLDPQARQFVWQKLRQLKLGGVTMVLTTHYLEEASQICDRLVIMDVGKIIEEGRPVELVKKHIGPEVLEVSVGGEKRELLLAYLQGKIKDYLSLGQTLYLYPQAGQELLADLKQGEFNLTHLLLRPANLEDVFFKLTGRGLA